MIKAIVVALTSCLLTLLAAEGTARLVLKDMDFGQCYVANRNPRFRRGWPEFTRPQPRPENTRLVIVISNSQGFMRERADASGCYAKQLQALLNEQDPRHEYIVANWSIPGGYGPEMTVLAARAAAHRPDAILLISYGRNFTSPHLHKPLSFGISDVDLLAYTPEVRALLPRWFLDKFKVDEAGKWLECRSAILRCRSIFSEPRTDKWTWEIVEPGPGLQNVGLKGAGQWSEESDKLLTCFADVVRQGSPDAELVIVNMPVCHTLWEPRAEQTNRDFAKRAERLVGARDRVTVLDAHFLLPPQPRYFYGHAHLRPEGHAAFAAWLAPRVLKALE